MTIERAPLRAGWRGLPAAAICVAWLGYGCSGFKSGDDEGAQKGPDASLDASSTSDGSRDASVEPASGEDKEDASRADDTGADVDAAGSSDADAIAVGDTHADAADEDTSHPDAVPEDGGATPLDADVAAPDGGTIDGDGPEVGSIDATPDNIRMPIVIFGHIKEFALPLSIDGVKEIVAGPDGALWIPSHLPYLVRVTTTGEFTERRVPPLPDGGSVQNLWSLIVGPDGHFWFATGIKSITRMTLQGVATTFPLPSAVQVDRLAAGPDGNIWFSDSANSTVDRLTMDGQVTAFALVGSAEREPGWIVAGPDQNLWFTQTNVNSIGRMTTTGVFTEFLIPTPTTYPNAITPGPDGNLWFNGGWNLVGRITPAGDITTLAMHGGDTGAGWIGQGITTGPDGNVWATQDGFVSSITPDGSTIKEYRCAPDCFPQGIAAGSDNMMWYIDDRRHVLGRVLP